MEQVQRWPLFDVFPNLKQRLAPIEFCALPTPIEAISGLGGLAWVKRDDLTHAVYGGNKTRKFEFILADILSRSAKHVYTLGGTGTNHGVATAMVCQKQGLKSTVVTFEQPASAHVDKNQALMKSYGAKVINLGSIIKAAIRYYLNPLRLNKKYYFLPGGGATPVATFAYINAALELKQQIIYGECPEPAEIYVPVGSSSTLAGLTLGCAIAGLKSKVVGIQILDSHVGPIETCTTGTSDKLIQQAIKTIQEYYPDFSVQLPDVTLDSTRFAPGYGVLTEDTEYTIKKAKTLGLTLEQTYSGKAFSAFLQAIETSNQPLLYWATYSSAGESSKMK